MKELTGISPDAAVASRSGSLKLCSGVLTNSVGTDGWLGKAKQQDNRQWSPRAEVDHGRVIIGDQEELGDSLRAKDYQRVGDSEKGQELVSIWFDALFRWLIADLAGPTAIKTGASKVALTKYVEGRRMKAEMDGNKRDFPTKQRLRYIAHNWLATLAGSHGYLAQE